MNTLDVPTLPAALASTDADLERRFGALRRLYGDAGYASLRAARVAVVGLGGVGSWAVEALARCGVAGLVLIDLDHVAESNINRQVQALGRTVGQSKAQALSDRVADIHPGCEVSLVEAFVDAHNWPGLLQCRIDAVVDACDQVQAKLAIAAWALGQRDVVHVCVGAAGGRTQAQAVETEDLGLVTHDALLASLRQRLRREHAAARSGRLGVRCVFSRESTVPVPAASGMPLACHGYGSSVTVTATFGMVAANEVIIAMTRRDRQSEPTASL